MNRTWYAIASAAVIFALASPAMADFSGDFAPANWTPSVTNSGNAGGSVNTAGAPASITLNSNSNGDFNFAAASNTTDFTIVSPVSGLVKFDYTYSENTTFNQGSGNTSDAGYLINGAYTPIAFNNGNAGATSFNVTAGDTFGFRIRTAVDGANQDDNVSNSFTVSNFSVPEPASMLLWGTAVATTAFVGWRRRRRA